MTGHPESGVLAEYQAGLVTGRRRASIASHLATCDRCAGLNDQLLLLLDDAVGSEL